MAQDQAEDLEVEMISKELALEVAIETLTILDASSRERKEESHLKAA
jgi:hypothetical protein